MERPELIFLKKSKLWKQLKKNADENQIAMVKDRVVWAMNQLDRIIETFPTYTLHNNVHQTNLVVLAEKLLGTQITKLSSLESAIIILSIYYHDIGMVFKPEEREDIKSNELFNDFILKNAEAELDILKNAEINMETREWFCRWAHAKRVRKFLSELGDEKLMWGSVSLRESLGNVCESHNWEIEKLKDDVEFSIKFLGDGDLRFCAIILRLVDILDFDSSRSPKSVYDYLGLQYGETERLKKSKEEFDRHLAADGFKFSDGKLSFIAGPNNPSVEKDIKNFIDLIGVELINCKNLLHTCSNRWRTFDLPTEIDTSNILSQNYRYGDFEFVLDKTQILGLLMGENLYEDSYIFIRELIQNAIDTSRHREYLENTKGGSFKIKDIEISFWSDQEGYSWIRVDDYGIGMDENKILKFLLNVGSSYYNSTEFELEKIKFLNKGGNEFTTISRFGVGILSCFLAGDKVEISTREKNENPIRLSLSGIENIYKLQTNGDIPDDMPHQNNPEKKYRNEVGTSVAVRFNPSKERIGFDLKDYLEKFLFNPEVPILFDYKHICEETTELISSELLTQKEFRLTDEELSQAKNFLGKDFKLEISISVDPINLNSFATSDNLNGQLLLVNLIVNKEIECDALLNFSVDINNNSIILVLFKRENINGRQEERRENISLLDLNKHIKEVINSFDINNSENLIISYNGIKQPTISETKKWNSDRLSFDNRIIGKYDPHRGFSSVVFGYISLKDNLRPNISISRNKFKSFDWTTYSNLTLTIYRGLNSVNKNLNLNGLDFFNNGLENRSFTYGELLEDKLITGENGWVIEKTHYDLLKIIETVNGGNEINLNNLKYDLDRRNTFTGSLHLALIQHYFKVIIKDNTYFLRKQNSLTLDVQMKNFVPLFFVEYEDSYLLKIGNRPINLNHPFARWLATNSDYLLKRYTINFEMIIINLSLANLGYSIGREPLTIKKVAETINGVLKRINQLEDGKLTIPNDVFLKEEDFSNKANDITW